MLLTLFELNTCIVFKMKVILSTKSIKSSIRLFTLRVPKLARFSETQCRTYAESIHMSHRN